MEDWRTWTVEELERQMSPSRWNPNKPADDVIQHYITICSAETQKARQNIPHMLDIPYGNSQSQKYDMYGTDLSEDAPFFFWIHGGFWQEGSKDISAQMAMNLYKIGVKTIVLGYTLAPKVTLRQILDEFHTALNHAMEKLKNPKLFLLGGHSAGAHLAASILHIRNGNLKVKERLAGLFLFSGVYDLQPVVSTYVNEALSLTTKDTEELSPLLLPFRGFDDKDELFILVCVGKVEPPEFIRQTRQYSSKLRSTFKNVQDFISSEDDHFAIVERLSDSSSEPGNYLLKAIKNLVTS